LEDADYFENDYLDKKDDKYYLQYQFKLNPIKDCDKSKTSEIENKISSYSNKLIETNLDFCKEGLCLRKANKTETDKYVCIPCDKN